MSSEPPRMDIIASGDSSEGPRSVSAQLKMALPPCARIYFMHVAKMILKATFPVVPTLCMLAQSMIYVPGYSIILRHQITMY